MYLSRLVAEFTIEDLINGIMSQDLIKRFLLSPSFSLLFSPSFILMFSMFCKEEEGDRRNKRKEKKEVGRQQVASV
jgi:hypothetical protein